MYLAVGVVGHVRCVSGKYVCSDAVGVGEEDSWAKSRFYVCPFVCGIPSHDCCANVVDQ
jgi:hypothetical protein